MLLEEFDQVVARDSTVLGSWNPVALQSTRVEPLADRARGHFTDLSDLSSCEDLHRRFSIRHSLTRQGFVSSGGTQQRYFEPPVQHWSALGVPSLRLWATKQCKSAGSGLTVIASAWLSSVPSNPRLTNDIGKSANKQLVKIRKMDKFRNNRPRTVRLFVTPNRRGNHLGW